jgi:hypothetical protein
VILCCKVEGRTLLAINFLVLECTVLVTACSLLGLKDIENHWFLSWIYIFLFGLALNCYTYFLSSFLNKASTAFVSSPIFVIMSVLVGGMLLSILGSLHDSFVWYIIVAVFRVLFCFMNLIELMLSMGRESEFDYLFYCIASMICGSFLYMATTIYIDHRQTIKKEQRINMPCAIDVANLDKRYENNFHAVRGISF